jgi:hypothetical protein
MTGTLLLIYVKPGPTARGSTKKKEINMAFKKEDIIIIEPKEMLSAKKDAPVTTV